MSQSNFAVFLQQAGVTRFKVTPIDQNKIPKRARRSRLEDELWRAAEQGRVPLDELPNHERRLTVILGNKPIFNNFYALASGCPPTF